MFRAAMGHFLVHFLGYSLKSGGEDVCLILSAALCFSVACSHDLRHEIAHLFGGAFLHLARDMGVGAEREACIEMSEHTRYRFCVYAILKRQGYKCVPLRYNYAKPEKLRISRVGGFRQGFSSFSKPRNRAAKRLYRTLAETAVPLAASFPSSIWFRLPGSSPRLAPHAPPFEA